MSRNSVLVRDYTPRAATHAVQPTARPWRSSSAPRTKETPKKPAATAFTVDAGGPALSLPKLRRLLVAAGGFPTHHRISVWQFLLQLPDNRQAWESLRSCGEHPCVSTLSDQCVIFSENSGTFPFAIKLSPPSIQYHDARRVASCPHTFSSLVSDGGSQECEFSYCLTSHRSWYFRYPLRDAPLLNALKSTLSQLAHWCPLFSEISFLPALAFPFVKLIRGTTENEADGTAVSSTAAFETVATLMSNWARHWFEMFPHPPLRYLEKFSVLLDYHDPEVAAHMSKWDGGTSAVAWELLSSLLTDVLGRQDWLKVRPRVARNQCIFYSSRAGADLPSCELKAIVPV